MTPPSNQASLQDLPSEILIDIFSLVDYKPLLQKDLQLVNKRFEQVIDTHEHRIAGSILDVQFTWARRHFPGLFDGQGQSARSTGWRKLATIFRRTAVLSNIKSRSKVIREGHGEHSAWTTCRALTFHHAGLLLLYSLSDSGKLGIAFHCIDRAR